MDHLQFKSNQTAAGYVANGLDESTQEAFELHMMGCSECVADVEVWRAIKLEMPVRRPSTRVGTSYSRSAPFGEWRIAASLVGVGLLGAGAAGGWLGKSATIPNVDSTEQVFMNLPSVSRGADECTAAHLAPDTQMLLIRVTGVPVDSRVVALDPQTRELPANQYLSRTQPDGSHLIRVNAKLLAQREIHLEIRDRDGTSSPLGCVTGSPPSS